MSRLRYTKLAAMFGALLVPVGLMAADTPTAAYGVDSGGGMVSVTDILMRVDNLWICIAAALVFIMHLGFATLESGLCRAKNTTNILFKNVMIISIGLLTYALCGFNLMYPGDFNNFIGFAGFGIPSLIGMSEEDLAGYAVAANYELDMTVWADFIFQGMFAATAATIVSGCVAERIKLLPFIIFSAIYVGFLYPVVGSWHWGGGWASDMGFYDFAGSTLVHSVGGWGGLAAIIVLGPRKGKYAEDGSVRPIVGHNLPLAAIGVFLLWLGWFGFNGGSVLSAEPVAVSYVLTTTSLAAAAGGLCAGFTSWIFGRKPDLTMALNGILAGLVAITACPDQFGPGVSTLIGAAGGVIVYFSVLFFDKIKIDDPVGALSVHLVCGIFGTLVAGFGEASDGFVTQLIVVIGYGAASFIFALVLALILKATIGWRVSEEEEDEGLDLGEHGEVAYHTIEAR